MNTYGYSSVVGEWSGSVPLAESQRTPMAALRSVISRLTPVMEPVHRPWRIRISWAEFDGTGAEIAFHELEEYAVKSWPEIVEQVDSLRALARARFAVSALFVDLETSIIESDGPVWKPDAGTLQLSIDQPELTPTSVEVSYSTFLDAWLSSTYDENRQPRTNRATAIANRPRLEAVLDGVQRLVGDSFQVGLSQTYPFAITERGFADVDELP